MTGEDTIGLICCLGFAIPCAVALVIVGLPRLDRLRYMALGAAVQSEHGALRVRPSHFVTYDVSILTTNRHDAPVALLLIGRTALSVHAVGANLTPEQARWLAQRLRTAALDRDPNVASSPRRGG